MIPRYSRPELAALWADGVPLRALARDRARGVRGDGGSAAPSRPAPPPAVRAAAARQARRRRASSRSRQTTRHDVIAFLTHVEELAGEPARWLHLGMTSSDVLDTALALQTGRALDRILDRRDSGSPSALAERAREHAKTPMIGRSHGIHAEPITAGLVFARWNAEVVRALGPARARAPRDRGRQDRRRGRRLRQPRSRRSSAAALARLGLEPETVATQIVARDRHAEVLGALALLGTAIEQIALGVRHWQRTEVGEAEEGFGAGQKGSSAMPHKKNPILSREPDRPRAPAPRLRAGRARGRRAVARARHLALERRAGRDAGRHHPRRLHARARDRPRARASSSTPTRMRANLERTGGLYFSEAVLLALVKTGLAAPARLRDGPALGARRDRRGREAGVAGARPGRFRELLGARCRGRRAARRRRARRLLRSRPPPPARARDPRSRARRSSPRDAMTTALDEILRAQLAQASTRPRGPHLGGARAAALRRQGPRLLHRRRARASASSSSPTG